MIKDTVISIVLAVWDDGCLGDQLQGLHLL